MPTPCYISITGQTQGNITAGAFTADSVGNIYVQGHEDEMLVQEFLHNVTVPTDPQSGQPAGQRAHKPFIFTVALNKAVPLMYNALASGEMLPTGQWLILGWPERVPEADEVPPPEPPAYRVLTGVVDGFGRTLTFHRAAEGDGGDGRRGPLFSPGAEHTGAAGRSLP